MFMADNALEQWQVEYNSGIPVYRQIINQACAAVAAGDVQTRGPTAHHPGAERALECEPEHGGQGLPRA